VTELHWADQWQDGGSHSLPPIPRSAAVSDRLTRFLDRLEADARERRLHPEQPDTERGVLPGHNHVAGLVDVHGFCPGCREDYRATSSEQPDTEPRTLTVQGIETHGDSDDVVMRVTGRTVVVTREKVQVDGATVALYDDQHYYPTTDPKAPSADDEGLYDSPFNEVWIEAEARATRSPESWEEPQHPGYGSEQPDTEPRTDYDDPALYPFDGMLPQCGFIVHWAHCRLDAGHDGMHSPGRVPGAPDAPSVALLRELLDALETEIALHPYEADAPSSVIATRNKARARLRSSVGESEGAGDA
jgi:hypothetical protein